jgi:hypothetical protein
MQPADVRRQSAQKTPNSTGLREKSAGLRLAAEITRAIPGPPLVPPDPHEVPGVESRVA